MYGNLDLPQSNTAISTTEFKNGQSSISGGGHSGIDQTYIYQVPQNSTFLYVFLVGGGGGGGRPNAAATTAGAGGGGSGAITKGVLLTALLPKTILVQVGRYGVGATANNTAGTAGGSSGIFGYSLPTGAVAVGNVILTALGGAGGAAATTGGAAGAAFTTASGRWAGALANWTSQVGIVGGAGATGAGVAVAVLASLPITGGGGGSGSTTAAIGGGITAQAGYTQIPTILGGASGGGAGNKGMGVRRPWSGCGGTGGGSIAGAGVGGKGGDAGWFGCGGGGGGNAQTTSGNGGNGGGGYALIIAF